MSWTMPPSMRGSLGSSQAPSIFTYVGRFVVLKNPSGKTPSAGAGANRALGAALSAGAERSGGAMCTEER